jgi:uncharacterized protein YyaL (SSP411 family)
LDDYAFFGRACLELFIARGRESDYATACQLTDAMIEIFEDPERGGFYFTSQDRSDLILRTRDLVDGAVPAGNSVATELCLRMHELTGEARYGRAGLAALDAFSTAALQNPYSGAHLLATAWRDNRGWAVVAVIGKTPQAAALERAALQVYAPETAVLRIDEAAEQDRLPAALRGKTAGSQSAQAFVCRGTVCSTPVATPEALRALLQTPVSAD